MEAAQGDRGRAEAIGSRVGVGAALLMGGVLMASAGKAPGLLAAIAGGTVAVGIFAWFAGARAGRRIQPHGVAAALGIGAAGGLAAGAVGGALTPLAAGLTAGMSRGLGALANAGLEAAAGMFCGALNMDVKTLLTNAAQHQPWYQGLVQSTLKGAATGGASKAASSLGKSAWAARDPIATRAVARGIISDATASKIHTLPETAKAAALSDEAIAGSIVAGYFLAASYTIWGVSKM